MENNTPNYVTRVRVLGVCLIGFLALFIMFLYTLTRETIPVRLANINSISNDRLTSDEIVNLRTELSYLLNDDTETNVSIRWSSFVQTDEEYKKFLIDIDSAKQTYLVTFISDHIFIECPEISQSKYPKSYCLVPGLDGEDTTNKTIGSILPYDGELDGVEYRVEQSSDDGELHVHIYDCYNDDVSTAITDSFDRIISDKGIDSDLFYYDVEFNYCGEDE